MREFQCRSGASIQETYSKTLFVLFDFSQGDELGTQSPM